MAPKKRTAAEAVAEKKEEVANVESPKPAETPNDAPPVDADNVEPVGAVGEGESKPAEDVETSDAPRLNVDALQVEPIAPDEDRQPVESEAHNFAWAARQMQNGLRVKRDAWIGNKFLDVHHRHAKHVIHTEDILASDWIVI